MVSTSDACPGITSKITWQRIHLGEVLGDLPLAEGVIQRVVDHLRLHAEPRRLIAVDREGGGAFRSCAGRSSRRAASAGAFIRSSTLGAQALGKLGKVGILQRVLELGLGQPAADADVLRRLQEELAVLRLAPASGATVGSQSAAPRRCRVRKTA